MDIENGMLVMVVDGARMLLFRNQGDGKYPDLRVEEALEQSDEATHELGASPPGRVAESVGNRRSAYGQTDFHQQEEDRLAAEAVAILNRRALANDFDRLIIVAPPRTLGEMRRHYHRELTSRLAGEIAKDLTGHPVTEIERIVRES